MKINEKQIQAVISLDSNKRYSHFIKRVADTELVWLPMNIKNNELAYIDNQLLLWPAKEYGDIYLRSIQAGYCCSSISLDTFFSTILPDLERSGFEVIVFKTALDDGLHVGLKKLVGDLDEELENYA